MPCPNCTLGSNCRAAVSGDTIEFIACVADVVLGGIVIGSRSARVIIKFAGSLWTPPEPLRFFFGPMCPDGDAGLERFLGVMEAVVL